jgi:hypothetical protein
MTTGETDFLLFSEADEAEAVIAALMASTAAGVISNVSTATGAEFKAIADRAAKAAKTYRSPGKKYSDHTDAQKPRYLGFRKNPAQAPDNVRGGLGGSLR